MDFEANAGDRITGLLAHVLRRHIDEILPAHPRERVLRNDLQGGDIGVLAVPYR